MRPRFLTVTFAGSACAFSASSSYGTDEPHHRGVTFGRSRSAYTPLKKFMMPDKGLAGVGAVCLDGSDAGFYFAPATSVAANSSWQIYFEGGGWCYDENDCWGRSSTDLGSSTNWPDFAGAGGIMNSDCNVNPDFCHFNRVYLKYCDGNSFSGDRTDPVEVVGPTTTASPKKLYFRGKRILDAVLATLAAEHGLRDATDVLLTGCSAGGLATYLHSDYVHAELQKIASDLKRYKAAPISGFFLNHATVAGTPVYPTEMRYIFALSNATNGVNAACIAAKEPEHQWECNFAQAAYAHTAVPIFPLNSALDSWQTSCIFASELPVGFPEQTNTDNGECLALDGWAACAQDPEKCNADGIDKMNGYIADFGAIMRNESGTYAKPGNGAFVHSCHTHCEAQEDGLYTGFAVNNVTMRQAVSSWWNADTTAPAAQHSYTPCNYKQTLPHGCNPTCVA